MSSNYKYFVRDLIDFIFTCLMTVLYNRTLHINLFSQKIEINLLRKNFNLQLQIYDIFI